MELSRVTQKAARAGRMHVGGRLDVMLEALLQRIYQIQFQL